MRADLLSVWLLRASWVLLAVPGLAAFGGALDGRSGAVQVVAAVILWAGWAGGLVAMLVPSPASLTAVRLLAPAAPVAGVIAATTGAGVVAATLDIALGALAALVAFTAEVGLAFVQAAAYGDEARITLRPPGPLLLGPLELAWAVLAAGLGIGPLLLAAGSWVAGGVLTAIGVVLAVPLVRRFHRLTLRWFVLVPAGVVVRDTLVLAETAMFRRATIDTIALAPAGTDAPDLTGRALGPAVEVTLGTTAVIALAGTLADHASQSASIRSFLVSPSRPGRLLAEAERRGPYAAVAPPTT